MTVIVSVTLTPANLCLTIAVESGSSEFSGSPGGLWHVMVSVEGHDDAVYTPVNKCAQQNVLTYVQNVTIKAL